MCAKDMVAQGTDDIGKRITGFESREERARRPRTELPLNETFPNNDANPFCDYEVVRGGCGFLSLAMLLLAKGSSFPMACVSLDSATILLIIKGWCEITEFMRCKERRSRYLIVGDY